MSPKSSLTDKILSFRFNDPNSFHFTHINNYLKTEVIELGIILTISQNKIKEQKQRKEKKKHDIK